MKNKGVARTELVSVVSTINGKVAVVLRCSLLGEILCHVDLVDGDMIVNLMKIENESLMGCLTEEGLNVFGGVVGRISAAAIKDCYMNADDWLVVKQYDDIDVLSTREIMENNKVSSVPFKEKRFPLFNGAKIEFGR